ncbi:MAG: PAS domain S-box protein, partial [Pseudomonadota bacterium]
LDISATISPILDEQGNIIGASKIVRDITGHKAAQAALQASAQLVKSILETVVDGIITIDSQGQVLSFNIAAERLFGYGQVEVIGTNVKCLMPEPYAFEHDDYLARYLQTREARVIGIGREVVGRRKDGSTFPMELAVSEMRQPDQTLFVGIVRDITERKQAESELQTATALRQAILDSANFSIISTDINGLILSFNQAAERLLGYTAREMVGQQTPAIIHVKDEIVARASELSRELGRAIEPGFEAFVAKARLNESADEREWIYVRKDGSRFSVLLSITALRDAQGQIGGFLGIAMDITERKQVERMKSEFVSTVSHELRTPLTSIRGALGLVIGKFASGLPDKARQLLETASRNAERLTLLINDILDLEKIESGRLEFEFKALDLVVVAKQAIVANEGYGQQHEVRLCLAESLERATIRADEHRLSQVFSNLISNAVKYSNRGGTVEVSVRRHEDRFRVSVRDFGRGIPAEFRNRIFQRFAQADSSDTREKGGTGLGLSITKAIVERHDGGIDFASEADAGTEFFFDLPE